MKFRLLIVIISVNKTNLPGNLAPTIDASSMTKT
jgi:hypothetical protein